MNFLFRSQTKPVKQIKYRFNYCANFVGSLQKGVFSVLCAACSACQNCWQIIGENIQELCPFPGSRLISLHYSVLVVEQSAQSAVLSVINAYILNMLGNAVKKLIFSTIISLKFDNPCYLALRVQWVQLTLFVL